VSEERRVKDRKVALLALLVAGWLALLGYRVLTHEPPKTAPLIYARGATASPAAAKVSDPALRVKVELLDSPRAAVDSPRNIFAPVQVYLPPPPPPPPAPTPAPPPPPPPPPTPEELAAQAARTELGQYKYLGYVEGGGRGRAFLSRGKDLFTVARGESLVGGILLKDLTPSYVVLVDPPTQIELTVPLSGN
jgi:hypothetical protein